jgi:hypothetical protein
MAERIDTAASITANINTNSSSSYKGHTQHSLAVMDDEQ